MGVPDNNALLHVDFEVFGHVQGTIDFYNNLFFLLYKQLVYFHNKNKNYLFIVKNVEKEQNKW